MNINIHRHLAKKNLKSELYRKPEFQLRFFSIQCSDEKPNCDDDKRKPMIDRGKVRWEARILQRAGKQGQWEKFRKIFGEYKENP